MKRILLLFLFVAVGLVLIKAWLPSPPAPTMAPAPALAEAPPAPPSEIRKPTPEENAARKKAADIVHSEFCEIWGDRLREIPPGSNDLFEWAMTERAVNAFQANADFTADIRARRASLGMGLCELIAALGNPQRINRSVNAAGERYQVVYPSGRYYYLNGNVLTAWQD